MVHKTTDPTSKHKIAVIGVLYKIGKPNPFLTKVKTYIDTFNKKKIY